MIADLLNTEITDLATVELLPIGAVLVDHANEQDPNEQNAWQKVDHDCYWQTGDNKDWPARRVLRRGPLTVVWLPPEVAA